MSIFRPKSEKEQALGQRLPPGQYLTEKWPVLHYGSVPQFDPKRWDFRISGLVEEPFRLAYDEIMALPHRTVKADVHCVTRWSMFDSEWEGIPVQAVLGGLAEARGQPRHRPRREPVHHQSAAQRPRSPGNLLAFRRNGENISPEHGWPLRLLVPHLYFWKSAKWVRGLELVAEDRPGFWEQYGYHMRGDPWKEERYGW